MLRSFIGRLDDYLAGNGSPAVVKGAIGILSFAGLLGALIGNAAIKSIERCSGALVISK